MRTFTLLTATAALLALTFIILGAGRDESRGPMTVVVDQLPQCPGYGVGYEHPMRIDLVHDDVVIETAFHSGIFTSDASLRVGFVLDDAATGRYTARFGRCPSILDSPMESVACEDVDWFDSATSRLTAGPERQYIRPQGLSATCLNGEPTVPMR